MVSPGRRSETSGWFTAEVGLNLHCLHKDSFELFDSKVGGEFMCVPVQATVRDYLLDVWGRNHDSKNGELTFHVLHHESWPSHLETFLSYGPEYTKML